MEVEKKVSTFTADEKEAMDKLNKFEVDINNKLEEGERISSIEYYEKLKLTEQLELNTNIYITKINSQDGTQRVEIYALDSDNLIGYLNYDGNIEFIDPLLKSLELEMTLEDLREINIDNIRAKAEELTPDELEEYISDSKKNKLEESDEKEKEVKDESEEEVNEELLEHEGKDLGITYYKEIQDKRLQVEFPELRGKNLGLAYSSTLNQFIITEKTEEGLKISNEIKPAIPTMRSTISISEDGEKVERKSPHALMETNRDDVEMAISIDSYGYIELEKVVVTPCNERVARPIEMESKREEPEYDVMRATDTEVENHEIAEQFRKGEERGREVQSLYTIIELEDGSTTTIENEASKEGINSMQFLKIFNEVEGKAPWEKLSNAHMIIIEAEKAKVSPEEFLRVYNNAEGRTREEKIVNTHEEIEEQYIGRTKR